MLDMFLMCDDNFRYIPLHLNDKLVEISKGYDELALGRTTVEQCENYMYDIFPDKETVCLSKQPGYQRNDCHVVPSLKSYIEGVRASKVNALIIGGVSVHIQTLQRKYCERMHWIRYKAIFTSSMPLVRQFDIVNWRVLNVVDYPNFVYTELEWK